MTYFAHAMVSFCSFEGLDEHVVECESSAQKHSMFISMSHVSVSHGKAGVKIPRYMGACFN